MAVKSARRRSREFAVQALYSWLLSPSSASELRKHFAGSQGFEKADQPFFSQLLAGVIDSAAELDALLEPSLDRKPGELSPVEHAILLMAAFELKDSAATPYRVVINEAVELAKSYGGTDGHKYVNGVLDKLARSMRPDDAQEPARPRPRLQARPRR